MTMNDCTDKNKYTYISLYSCPFILALDAKLGNWIGKAFYKDVHSNCITFFDDTMTGAVS